MLNSAETVMRAQLLGIAALLYTVRKLTVTAWRGSRCQVSVLAPGRDTEVCVFWRCYTLFASSQLQRGVVLAARLVF